jgi:hypothetical protein
MSRMASDSSRRLDRLAKRAKQLDDAIQKAAQMRKRIVEEIRRIGKADKGRLDVRAQHRRLSARNAAKNSVPGPLPEDLVPSRLARQAAGIEGPIATRMPKMMASGRGGQPRM